VLVQQQEGDHACGHEACTVSDVWKTNATTMHCDTQRHTMDDVLTQRGHDLALGHVGHIQDGPIVCGIGQLQLGMISDRRMRQILLGETEIVHCTIKDT